MVEALGAEDQQIGESLGGGGVDSQVPLGLVFERSEQRQAKGARLRNPCDHRMDLDTMPQDRRRAFDDKKPQPQTVGACRIHAVKRLEDVRQLANGDADAVVAYLEAYRRAALAGSNKHAATAGRIVDRVANEVSQYSAHQYRVARHGSAGRNDAKPDPSLLCRFEELGFGLFYTPFLFLRTFLRNGSPIRNKKLRRRIWAELALIAFVWFCLLAAVTWLGEWKYILWMYLAPALLAASMQSWRKYIEHVGLTGSSVNSSTRSIVSEGLLGRLVAFTLLHEPYHGVHHQHSGLPHAELPQHASELEPKNDDEISPFPSYRHALVHLLQSLADPRAGAQWRTGAPP